jgi:hypothetical protein
MIAFRLAFLDINIVADITSAAYQVTLESLFVQGELEVVKEVHRKHIMEKREDGDELNGDAGSVVGTADGTVTETSKVPFLMLGLDLPPPPLFKDAMEKNIIPQVCHLHLVFSRGPM